MPCCKRQTLQDQSFGVQASLHSPDNRIYLILIILITTFTFLTRDVALDEGGVSYFSKSLPSPLLLAPWSPPHRPQVPMSLIPEEGEKVRIRWLRFKRDRAFLLQENPPGVEPFQIDSRQQGVKDAGHHDDKRQRRAQAVQQLVRLILLCKRPNVEDKSRVSLPHLGS